VLLYAPDLNPIEQLFAKLKALQREAKRTLQAAGAASATCSLSSFPPSAPTTSQRWGMRQFEMNGL